MLELNVPEGKYIQILGRTSGISLVIFKSTTKHLSELWTLLETKLYPLDLKYAAALHFIYCM